jgi:hypothetical protein
MILFYAIGKFKVFSYDRMNFYTQSAAKDSGVPNISGLG